jgi:hypothetical protein
MFTGCNVGAGANGAPLAPPPWLLKLGRSAAWRLRLGAPLVSIGNEFFELRSKRESEGTGGASSKLRLWRDRFSADLACLKKGKFEMEGFLRDWPPCIEEG